MGIQAIKNRDGRSPDCGVTMEVSHSKKACLGIWGIQLQPFFGANEQMLKNIFCHSHKPHDLNDAGCGQKLEPLRAQGEVVNWVLDPQDWSFFWVETIHLCG